MTASLEDIRKQKALLRKQAVALRDAQPDKDALSQTISARLASLPEFRSAQTILFYVHTGSEVRTQPLLRQILAGSQCLLVPYCHGRDLKLFRLEAWEELALGTFGILEPRSELRLLPEKEVSIQEVDVAVVPGVAFDPRGGRLGHGQGYYDRLLAQARPETVLIGLAYQCQIYPQLPVLPTDVSMNQVITELNVYMGLQPR